MSDTFCPIPWNFQAVRNNGDLRICCQANISKNSGILKDEDGNVLNAKNADLDKARNAPIMKSVRAHMLKDEWAPECTRCQKEEQNGLNSRRQYELSNWSLRKGDVLKYTQKNGELSQGCTPVVYYDLRFGNLCNLACRMCGPTDSSAWYSDYVQLTKSQEFHDSHGAVPLTKIQSRWVDKTNSYNWYESQTFWDSLEKNLSSAKHIYMAGGEPLLIKQHYDFLEKCIAQSLSQNIILEYNTNMTKFPDKAIALWKNFKQVRVGASIDGYGKVFEFQRYPAQWSSVYENLKKLDALPSPVMSWIAYTVTVYNVMHLPEFIRWKLQESGFKNISSSKKKPVISYHMAHNPKHLNVKVLSPQQKQTVSDHFKKYLINFQNTVSESIYIKIKEILDSVESYMNSENFYEQHFERLAQFNQNLDEIRNESSQEFIP